LAIDLQYLQAHRGVNLAVWPPQYDRDYRPPAGQDHWLPEVECARPRDRDELIFAKLTRQVQWAWERSPFYRRLWQQSGVSPGTLKCLEDLSRFPVVQKDELRAVQDHHPPFGDLLCVEPGEIARIHGTSGTTGRPVVFGISAGDWERIANAHARIMWGAGLRPAHRIIVCSFFSLYVGSWGALIGGERLGAAMFPFGAGVAGQTARAVQWAQIVKPSAFYGTPSYALRFAEAARAQNVDPRSLGLRILFFSGEPGAGIPATRRLIEETFGGACIDMGSMAEMMPWMSNAECSHRTGMHLWQDLVYTEICDPQTFKPVPFGSEGTPVYTHLERASQPMIRLASNDRSRWVDAPCACGRTYPRLPDGIYGRYDDMLVIRGENVYPSAIEDVLRSVEGFGGEFQIIVSRAETMDELLIQVEHAPTHAARQSMDGLKVIIVEQLRMRLGIRPNVELLPQGSLPRTEFKSRRIVDNRGLYRQVLAKNRQAT
jgi:phenylacetate-coenzyme A ligase PaaK-like adenylate-forming protein